MDLSLGGDGVRMSAPKKQRTGEHAAAASTRPPSKWSLASSRALITGSTKGIGCASCSALSALPRSLPLTGGPAL